MKKASLHVFLIATLCLFSSSLVGQDADSIAFSRLDWSTVSLHDDAKWQHIHIRDSVIFSSRQNLHIVSVKKVSSTLELGVSRSTSGDDHTSTLAFRDRALVAVNASFFNTKTGQSVNMIKQDGQIVDTTVTKAGRYSSHQMGILAFDSTGVQLYQRDTGLGTQWDLLLREANAIESGPILRLDGADAPLASNAFNTNRHPRTIVGIRGDDVVLLTADGRTSEAYGLSLFEAQKIMRWLGCTHALNFDGGGSTAMYIRGMSCTGIVNMPCDNRKFDHEGERKVSNALVIKVRK